MISSNALTELYPFSTLGNVIFLDDWKCTLPPVRRIQKIRKIRRILDGASQTNDSIIYMRYTPPDFSLLRLAKKYSNRIITEHQTFELHEWFSNHNWLPLLFEVLLGKRIRQYIGGFSGVTSEICKYELLRAGKNIPSFVASNGVDVSSVSLRHTSIPLNNEPLNLLCVAQVAKWHGLDRLICGLADSGNPNVCLHVVGDGPAIPFLIKLVQEKALEKQVFFHGFKTGQELDDFFNKCHIAVGSLGVHRKGLQETSDLKSREYCARGIPFFSSAFDADFPDSFPYRLKVPADESPIEIGTVVDFASKVLSDSNHPQKMREYAAQNLDWTVKMRKLKSFFEEVIAKER